MGFKAPEDALRDAKLFLSHVMTYGTWSDIATTLHYFSEADFESVDLTAAADWYGGGLGGLAGVLPGGISSGRRRGGRYRRKSTPSFRQGQREDPDVGSSNSLRVAAARIHADEPLLSHSHCRKIAQTNRANCHERCEPSRAAGYREGDLGETPGSPVCLFPIRQHRHRGNRASFKPVGL